jgi:hypothetical protein
MDFEGPQLLIQHQQFIFEGEKGYFLSHYLVQKMTSPKIFNSIEWHDSILVIKHFKISNNLLKSLGHAARIFSLGLCTLQSELVTDDLLTHQNYHILRFYVESLLGDYIGGACLRRGLCVY